MPLQIGFGPNCEVCGGVNQVWSYFHNIFCPPWSPFYSDKCNFSGHWHKQLIFETFLEYMSCKITNNRYMKMLMKFQIGFGPKLCSVNQKWSYLHNIFRPPWSPVYSDKCNFAGHWHKQPILGDNRVGHASKNQPDTFCNIGLQQEFDFAEGSWKIKNKHNPFRIVWSFYL